MSPVADAVKQLLVAQGATGRLSETAARASASSVAQLHSKVMAPARILAPSDIGTTGLPLLITTKQREALARASRGTITWLTRALDQQHITGAMAVRQACELLCALSDVVFAVLAVKESIGMTPGTTTSSSTTITSGPRGYDASVFMRLDGAGGCYRRTAQGRHQGISCTDMQVQSAGVVLSLGCSTVCGHVACTTSQACALQPGILGI
jgi:hypothetical protein